MAGANGECKEGQGSTLQRWQGRNPKATCPFTMDPTSTLHVKSSAFRGTCAVPRCVFACACLRSCVAYLGVSEVPCFRNPPPWPLAGKLQSDERKGRVVAATATGTAARVRREARKSERVDLRFPLAAAFCRFLDSRISSCPLLPLSQDADSTGEHPGELAKPEFPGGQGGLCFQEPGSGPAGPPKREPPNLKGEAAFQRRDLDLRASSFCSPFLFGVEVRSRACLFHEGSER